MAKITSKKQKIFCGDVSVNSVVAQFGSLKAASPIYSDDIDTLTSLAAWTNGWSDAVLTSNAPTIQDMNGLFYVISKQLAYLMQSGIPEWDAATTYYIGSFVSDGVGGIYKSVIDDNTDQALTDAAKWLNYSSNHSVIIGDNYDVVNDDYIITWSGGAPTVGHDTVNLPVATTALKGRKIIIISLQGTINVKSDGVLISNVSEDYGSEYLCMGSSWIILGYGKA